MAHFKILSVVAFLWLLATSTSAAPAAVVDDLNPTIRIDDLVVLSGNVLKFDPIGGLNSTTQDSTWQLEYLKSLDSSKIAAVHHEQQHLTYESMANNTIIVQRNDDFDSVVPLHKRQLTPHAICFDCMLLVLLSTTGESRTFAYGVCEPVCGSLGIRLGGGLGIATQAVNLAAQLGLDWRFGYDHAQRFYMAWLAAPTNF
ncbi:hypothetical protein B0H66DRAFT_631630 [Apodospora peruviana]|uniref:Uncharacterized protein n=1 Tax=Apodospora peruviana TaxID=516989 RepID=A0AAE0HVP3_9PEZI|nr:hypothetical protein B0H66DRAFT_631630 [Apodospora peruviana]